MLPGKNSHPDGPHSRVVCPGIGVPGTSVCTHHKPGKFPGSAKEERERVSPANGVMGDDRAPSGALALPKFTGRTGLDGHHPALWAWGPERLVGD